MEGVNNAKSQAEALLTLEKAQAENQVVDPVDITHLDDKNKDNA
jgi:hypothetical protein